jgi:hypothetical protein
MAKIEVEVLQNTLKSVKYNKNLPFEKQSFVNSVIYHVKLV